MERRLIRPTLFMIARLGLFLAVVTWFVGQWWQVYAGMPGPLEGGVNGFGWALVHSGNPNNESFIQSSQVEKRKIHHMFIYFHAPRGSATRLGGVIVGYMPKLHWISIRHWLIVTIFALFNGVLMWVYRKRRKELAADE